MTTMHSALEEAGRKARRSSTHNRIPGGSLPASESIGQGELSQRRQDARLGSARLLDRLNAYYARRVA